MQQLIIVLALIACAFSTHAEDTVLKLYRPFDNVVIKHELNGNCNEQSHSIMREDAWRCEAQGQWFDPCFAKVGTKDQYVLCPSSPWTRENTRINLNEVPINSEHQSLDMSRTFPWMVELTNGERCAAFVGEETFDSMPVRYICGAANKLVGTIARCDPAWSMLEKTDKGVERIEIKKAWF